MKKKKKTTLVVGENEARYRHITLHGRFENNISIL